MPKEENHCCLLLKGDYGKPVRTEMDEQNQAEVRVLNESADIARSNGATWVETLLCFQALEVAAGKCDFDGERTLRAERLGTIYGANLGGSNIFADLATDVLPSTKAPPDPSLFAKALELLDRSRRTREQIDVPDSVINTFVYKST